MCSDQNPMINTISGNDEPCYRKSISSDGLKWMNTNQWMRLLPPDSSHSSMTWWCHNMEMLSAWISNYIHYKVWDEITYPFLNFNGCTIEVKEWISNFISHFIMDVITYPCWDWSYTMFVKGVPGVFVSSLASTTTLLKGKSGVIRVVTDIHNLLSTLINTEFAMGCNIEIISRNSY